MSEPIPYDPNCLHCRRDAGKDSASVTRLCEAHKDAQLAAFQPYLKDGETPIERLERERHDNDTLLTQLAHSKRDAEAARSDRDRFQHDLAEAREKLAEREATVDILVQRVHERDAELGELKQSGKTERRFTNDYIKALHKAERDRDEFKTRWQRTIDELGRVIHVLAETDDVTVAVNACQPHASDLAKQVVAERDEARAEVCRLRDMVETWAIRAEAHRQATEAEKLATERAHDGCADADLYAEQVKRANDAGRERDEAVALLRDGAVLIRGYGDGKYPNYPEGLLVAIDEWLARLDAFLAGGGQ